METAIRWARGALLQGRAEMAQVAVCSEAAGLELVFQVWRRWAVWHGIDRGIFRCKRHETGKWEESMAARVKEYLNSNDTMQAWAQMRILGGTERRERKRNVRGVNRFDPSPQEWAGAMAESGGQSGL